MRLLTVFTVAVLLLGALSTEPPVKDDRADPLASISDPHTMSQLLQWSLANQDLDALHRKAEALRSGSADADGAGGDNFPPPGVLSAAGNVGELPAEDVVHLGGGSLPSGTGGSPSIRPSVQQLTPERKAELNAMMGQMMPDVVGLMRECLAT